VKAAWFHDLDSESVLRAKGALGTMLGDHGLEQLIQSDVQDFLWYTLPAKWDAGSAEHHEVAWSLGDVLRNAGLDRYADLCRSTQTHLIIDAYAVSRADGFAAYRAAAEASGIEPPDTELIKWGPVMGPAEYAVRDRLSSRLEQEIVAGRLTPGARGWKKVAERIAAEFLSSEGPDDRRPIDVVEVDRLERWGRDGRPHRSRLNGAVLPFLLKPPEGLVKVESLAPARALLEAVGDGVTLTKAGYLPTALVLELNDRFRWHDLPQFKVRSEADIPDLQWLHDLLRKTKLLTKRGPLLSVSALGRRCLEDEDELFRLLAVRALAGDDCDADLARLSAGVLLKADQPTTRQQVADAVRPTVDETWRTKGGLPMETDELVWCAQDWRAYGRIFGWIRQAGKYVSDGDELTPIGRAAAIIGLRAAAAGPRSN
jgi:hypothetical protein